jgi:peptidoglycan/xylan/chitin deacetylase (PgdA/CDA1 family)
MKGLASLLLGLVLWAPSALAQAPRPPQFVLLAFDGSLNLDMWRDTLAFARANDVRFTYFISGVYFLLDGQRERYVEPTHGPGHSNIGFGGASPAELRERVARVNEAHATGHEIASHVNGHFDGTRWTLAEWQSELEQFPRLVFGVGSNNGLTDPPVAAYAFAPETIRGFRAPLLGHNDAMYQALAAHRYSYDTSKTSPPGYWPERRDGIWNFPLAELRIAGTGKRTLSMDYNFYFAQSEGKPDPAHAAEYRDEMVRTYLAYFASSYVGNRAPVHIGHHFSRWNDGAYWDAMQEFARTVCHLPEVRCTTYRELEAFLEQLPDGARKAYARGEFDKSEFPEAATALARAERGIEADLLLAGSTRTSLVKATVSGADAQRLTAGHGARTVWRIDGVTVARGKERSLDLRSYRSMLSKDSRVSVSVERRGREVLKATHLIEPAGRGFRLSETPDEFGALSGDHPDAHRAESH